MALLISLSFGTLVTMITNASATSTFDIGGPYSNMMLVDVSYNYALSLGIDPATLAGNPPDGFDVDAISVSAVPVPAAALLMGSAIGALGFVRRRKSRKA